MVWYSEPRALAEKLAGEIDSFLADKERRSAEARQLVALRLVCGIDLGEALTGGREARRRVLLQLGRTIERERLKGARGHWTYDLNRHIALKEVMDRLRRSLPTTGSDKPAGNGIAASQSGTTALSRAGKSDDRGSKRKRRHKAPPQL